MTEKSVRIRSTAEPLVNLSRYCQPAATGAVAVLQFQNAASRIEARAAEEARGDVMSVHGEVSCTGNMWR